MKNLLTRMSYSVDEAATIIGIGRTTLYRIIKSGQLPTIKIGTRTLIRRSDLEGLLNSGSKLAA